jgi:hypothetical protein
MPVYLRSALACAALVSITMPPCTAVCAPKTAEAAKPHEGTLDLSIDTESTDASVRLKAMEQEQYALE